ncbi:hypothetical protein [Nocardioides sp.]|uniref:hypothetical protein n=1 Tax=Nocardioides sp. TaxID=35761 RepID=UPI003512C531
MSLTALDTYSGSALKSRFTFRSSGAAVRDLEFTLRRLDASRDGSGTPITDDFVRSVDPLTSQYTFRLPPNARGIEQSSYHEAEWSVPGYPGTWYVFVRGLQAFRDANGGYRFYDSPIEIMESLPAGGGYAAP